VDIEVSGAGRLVAFGTANPVSEEVYVSNQRDAYQGRLMAVVCTSGEPGTITVRAHSDGIESAAITLVVE
jgi:beta-galactosidase